MTQEEREEIFNELSHQLAYEHKPLWKTKQDFSVQGKFWIACVGYKYGGDREIIRHAKKIFSNAYDAFEGEEDKNLKNPDKERVFKTWQIVVGLISAFLGGGLIVSVYENYVETRKAPGWITCEIKLKNAEVDTNFYVDSEFHKRVVLRNGSNRVTLDSIPVGTHQVMVESKGYMSKDTTIEVSGGKEHSLEFSNFQRINEAD